MFRKFALPLGAIALAALGYAWIATPQSGLPALGEGFVGAANAAEAEIQVMSIGNPDAKVELVEYASYTCSHCKNFHDNVYRQLKTDYIDTGKLHFVYREVYWDRYALWAGLVARCGGESRFFGIVDMIFDKQREWAGAKQPAQVVEQLRTIGRAAGLSNDELDACLQDGDMAQSLVAWSDTESKAANVEGTPTLYINGEKYPNMSYKDLKAILDEKLAE
ncbi:DsbA family protein [Actibacterium sp. MT2.3-13A]|uniref:DsbA family protein n=1 Tax=Actibacterium sp. MT2.3-13A TaxID=2828332 RepID=UPI001BACC42A|nr:DsbA family protein [Actibacterium sp. MT2.3-13A]